MSILIIGGRPIVTRPRPRPRPRGRSFEGYSRAYEPVKHDVAETEYQIKVATLEAAIDELIAELAELEEFGE